MDKLCGLFKKDKTLFISILFAQNFLPVSWHAQNPPLSFYVLRLVEERGIPFASGNDGHTGTVWGPLPAGS